MTQIYICTSCDAMADDPNSPICEECDSGVMQRIPWQSIKMGRRYIVGVRHQGQVIRSIVYTDRNNYLEGTESHAQEEEHLRDLTIMLAAAPEMLKALRLAYPLMREQFCKELLESNVSQSTATACDAMLHALQKAVPNDVHGHFDKSSRLSGNEDRQLDEAVGERDLR